MTIRSDVYAVGLTIWELLTGQHPFGNVPEPELPAAIAGGIRQRLRDAAPHVPPALARIVEKAVKPDPADRYATAAQMDAALARVALPERVWQEEPPPAGIERLWTSPGLRVTVIRVSPTRAAVETVRPSSRRRVLDGCFTTANSGLTPALKNLFRHL